MISSDLFISHLSVLDKDAWRFDARGSDRAGSTVARWETVVINAYQLDPVAAVSYVFLRGDHPPLSQTGDFRFC
jgi:hypothetical protein